MVVQVRNYIDGEWRVSKANEYWGVYNPATAEKLGEVPLSTPQEVDEAAQAAQRALKIWRETPPGDRIQYLFKLKFLLEEHFEELSRQITMECGKTIVEARGEMRRAIENVEVASGIPSLLQGAFSEDIAPGIDEYFIRQPVGVVAIICPFNFPGMIPFWFMPYALACGNTVIVKPSEKVPLTMQKIFALMEQCGFPKGVINLVNGAKETVDAILDHPLIRAISMVGSTPVARYIYARAAANGKRAQCQGGAKNISVVLPDADLETSTRVLADSAFGSAGQRCLATSIVAPVGEVKRDFVEAICEIARNRVVGYGLDEGVEMGPVITPQSKARIEGLIGKAEEEDATILVDGRGTVIKGYENGNFVRPTVILNIPPQGELFRTEIFGPVLSIMPVNTIEEAIDLVNLGDYGNMACLFTKSGEAARKFRYHVQAGNVGINIGVAAPMAYFPFSGWKESFFGDLHGQSMDAVEFFTQKKVVIERWPKEWSRKF
ncbi:MAG: methylmalonate-semialdehyde dehydrogenase (CoA acylating) [Anaerolineae bacterium]|jgi:malonate-semialdehyde dehydrogenase (acetylating)/methylmalonate-semialdehyde dehydrogenase|nr:MAG: methylmalonate-semialdehyde dehydrogenase (CoA acylating) [Anaerolineae bacterium]